MGGGARQKLFFMTFQGSAGRDSDVSGFGRCKRGPPAECFGRGN